MLPLRPACTFPGDFWFSKLPLIRLSRLFLFWLSVLVLFFSCTFHGWSQTISTVAGAHYNDNALATQTPMLPTSITADKVGNLYITDMSASRVLKKDAVTGRITILAGNGAATFSGDGGPAVNASLRLPSFTAVDVHGNVYIADYVNNRIRKVDATTGIITTVAGDGNYRFSGDGGPATSASFKVAAAVVVDENGNLYISDDGNNRIRKVDGLTGVISTIAGTGTAGSSGDGGLAIDAKLSNPKGLALDSQGDLYVADSYNSVIRKIDLATGIITRVAGNGVEGNSGNGGAATSARLNLPGAIAIDQHDNLFIVDENAHVVRMVSASTGIISTVAGSSRGYNGMSGSAASIKLQFPEGIAVDPTGSVYIADSFNHVIRKLDLTTAQITVAAGNGTTRYSGEGNLALNTAFSIITNVGVDRYGNLYFTDSGNHQV